MNITEQSVVVTGGASGLGAAVVAHFLELGARVASLDLGYSDGSSDDEAGETQQPLCIKTDVTSEDSVKAALERVKAVNGPVEILVNAAGIAADFKRTFGKHGAYPLSLFRKVVEVNLIGSFNCTRLAAEYMSEHAPLERGERGAIINVSSISAFDGPVGTVAYTAAKAGVHGMTLTLARDLAKYGIRVCTIAPGSFDTPMLREAMDGRLEELVSDAPFPNDRLGDPRDFARLAETICKNPMINGETVRLDGAARLAYC